jgi:hypothetical protein
MCWTPQSTNKQKSHKHNMCWTPQSTNKQKSHKHNMCWTPHRHMRGVSTNLGIGCFFFGGGGSKLS